MRHPPPDTRGRLMLAFEGLELPEEIRHRLATAPAAGLTLFRFFNVDTPAQVRELTTAAQRAAAEGGQAGPLLIAADQEGGQLLALGDGATPFPGSMALGATGDPALAERVGLAIGRELLAMGVNTCYAPVCDLATNPANPHLGIRSFGDDPATVASFAAAMVRGLRSAGVAAAAKHFPGLGEADLDTHHGLPDLALDRRQLVGRELVPFAAAIDSGADLVMSAHVALSQLTGDPTLPATLSAEIMRDLVRGELGFKGLTITDALDMGALPQGDAQVIDVLAALRAGIDLLLCGPDPAKLARIDGALRHAGARRLLGAEELGPPAARLAALRGRLAGVAPPPLEVVGCAEHAALAREVAARSITLLRDLEGRLPLRPAAGDTILAVMPMPRELTPADTSAAVAPGLGAALRARWPGVREVVTSHPPTDAEISAVVAAAREASVTVIGTIAASADPAQVRLVEAIAATGCPLVTVSLRTPWDAAAYPAAGTHVAAYGLLRPTLDALVAALFGDAPMPGRLPVAS